MYRAIFICDDFSVFCFFKISSSVVKSIELVKLKVGVINPRMHLELDFNQRLLKYNYVSQENMVGIMDVSLFTISYLCLLYSKLFASHR